jgi:hypothetical protein
VFFVLLAFCSAVLTGFSWIDYLQPRPFEDVVVAVHDVSTKEQPLRRVEFEKVVLPLLFLESPQPPYWRAASWLAGGLDVDDRDMRELQPGDRTTLWFLPWTRKLTGTLRMPLALSVMSLSLMGLALLPGSEKQSRSWPYLDAGLARGEIRAPDGSSERTLHHPAGRTEVTLKGRRRGDLLLPMLLPAGGMLLGLLSMIFTLILLAANFSSAIRLLDYEWMARALFTLVLPAGVMVPLLGFVLFLTPGAQVAWNDRTIWVNRQRIVRSQVRRIALVPRHGHPALEILVAGWSQALLYSLEPIWIAGQLERLGYTIEFSEKSISEPIRLFKARAAI